MDPVQRPLSPHLGVYRWMITNTLSILHRATGVFLSLGIVVLVWWLVALADGPQAHANAVGVLGSVWFKLLLTAWAFCFFYHAANGIRHLFWDVGIGFDHVQYRTSGWAVVAVSVLATLAYTGFVIF